MTCVERPSIDSDISDILLGVAIRPSTLCVADAASSLLGRASVRSERKRPGFTLIELIVVVAIIATLASVVAPAVFRNVGDAKVNAAKSQIEMLALALNAYRLDNDRYPSTSEGLQALREPPTSARNGVD